MIRSRLTRGQINQLIAQGGRSDRQVTAEAARVMLDLVQPTKYRAVLGRVGVSPDGVMLDFFNVEILPPDRFAALSEADRGKLLTAVARIFAPLAVLRDLLDGLDKALA